MPVTRKLVAVVMADVVGYSRLMERDEAGTHQRLRALNDELLIPKIAEHGGRVVHTAGDGMLLEFPSATSALRCAVEIQREMGVRNLYIAADERIELRIGINLGDIIVEGQDIIGDGVNVAARLETLAEPGGICVASAIWEQVHEDLGIEFIDAGEQHVKNISKPVRVFRVALGRGTAAKNVASTTGRSRRLDEAIQRDPSLVAAWIGRADTYAFEFWGDLAGDREPLIAGMERDSLRALALDDRDPMAWQERSLALRSQWRLRRGVRSERPGAKPRPHPVLLYTDLAADPDRPLAGGAAAH